MRKPLLLLVTLLSCVLTIPVTAQQQDLYDNGPTDGRDNAWTINFGFAVSDQFTLSSFSEIGGIQFAAWLMPGDVLETVDVSITSSEFGGTSYFDQAVSFESSGCFANGLGFNVCTETGSFTAVVLNAGSYWLTLQNAVVSDGDPVYWDQNAGPSLASENDVGTIPSESFTVLSPCEKNSPGCIPPPTSPEPNSFLLFGSSVLISGLLLAWTKMLR